MKPKRRTKNGGWFLYMLRCSDRSLYTGIARDILLRIAAHQKGHGSKYVRSRLPVELVYSERLSGLSRALKREAEIKRWTRPQKLVLIAKRKKRSPR